MQPDSRAESHSLLPTGSEGDCRRDCDGGLRTNSPLGSQGESPRPMPARSPSTCLRVSTSDAWRRPEPDRSA